MSTIDFSQCFLLPAPKDTQIVCISLVCMCIVGVEFQSLLELSLSSRKIPFPCHLHAAQIDVGTGQGGVQFKCFEGGSSCLRDVFDGAGTVVRQYGVGIGQPCIRRRVAGVFGNGLIEIGDCRLKVCTSPFGPVGAPLQIQLIGFWILCALLASLRLFRSVELSVSGVWASLGLHES